MGFTLEDWKEIGKLKCSLSVLDDAIITQMSICEFSPQSFQDVKVQGGKLCKLDDRVIRLIELCQTRKRLQRRLDKLNRNIDYEIAKLKDENHKRVLSMIFKDGKTLVEIKKETGYSERQTERHRDAAFIQLGLKKESVK